MIEVTICPPSLDLREEWEALVRSAPPNVFLSPEALCAAQETGFADILVLRAYSAGGDGKRLVGLWAVQQVNVFPLWPPLLSAPPFEYAFVSTPVIAPDCVGEVVPAFLAAIEREKRLPNVIRLKFIDGDAPACAAMLQAFAAGRKSALTLASGPRPYVTREAGVKNSGSTRKKLRQDWNRLASLGEAAVTNERSPAQVREDLEVFLKMEAESWKGKHGTALLSDAKDAAFARRLIVDLANAGNASVALLWVGGTPVAAQVLLYCGRVAYTWKTAFNAEYAKYSPGMLLIDKVTEQLFAGERVQEIESCSPHGSFMEQLWSGRRTTIDMLVDVGERTSLTFRVVAGAAQAYAALREWRNRLRPMLAGAKKKSLAPSP